MAEVRQRHLAAFFRLGRRVDASEAALAWRWSAGDQLVLGPDSTGDVGGPVFGRVGRRSLAGPPAAELLPLRGITGPARRPLRRPGRSDAGDLHRRRKLEVVRRRRRRLVDDLHLAGRDGAAAGAGVAASAEVEDDGPVSVA